MVEVKEKHFKTKYRPVSTLLKYFCYDLLLFYSCKFPYCLTLKYTVTYSYNLGRTKIIGEKKTAYRRTVTSLLLKYYKQLLIDVTSFRFPKSLYSQSILFKPTNNFGSVYPNRLAQRIYETKFPIHACFLPPPPPPPTTPFDFILLLLLQLFFDAQNLPFLQECSHVINLPVSFSM
jgi:hypothetical protein